MSKTNESTPDTEFDLFRAYLMRGDLTIDTLAEWGERLYAVDAETCKSVALDFVKTFSPPAMSPQRLKNLQADIIRINQTKNDRNTANPNNVTIRGETASENPTPEEMAEFGDIRSFIQLVDDDLEAISTRLNGAVIVSFMTNEEVSEIGMVLKFPSSTLWFSMLAMTTRILLTSIVQEETLVKFERVIERIDKNTKDLMHKEMLAVMESEAFESLLTKVLSKVILTKR